LFISRLFHQGEAMDRFICPECRAEYAVTECEAPADREPTCEQCDHPFRDEGDGGWMRYERIGAPQLGQRI